MENSEETKQIESESDSKQPEFVDSGKGFKDLFSEIIELLHCQKPT